MTHWLTRAGLLECMGQTTPEGGGTGGEACTARHSQWSAVARVVHLGVVGGAGAITVVRDYDKGSRCCRACRAICACKSFRMQWSLDDTFLRFHHVLGHNFSKN